MIEYWDIFIFVKKKLDLYNYINPFFNENYLEAHNFFAEIFLNKKYKNYLDNIYIHIDKNIKLDYEQKKAILVDPLHELIIAGAGSGKTTTIAAKIKYLVDIKKVEPGKILLLSYTNASVNDMKKIINDGFKINAKILTFHKFALLLLNKKIVLQEKYDYKEIVANYSIIEKILLNIYLYMFSDLTLFDVFQKNKAFSQAFDEFQNHCNKFYYEGNHLIKSVKSNLFAKNSKIYFKNLPVGKYTFDRCINEARIKKQYDYHFKYVFVDEYQDISNMRFAFLKNYIAKEKSKLVCVGDDWQTIFSFASSNIKNILNFNKLSNSKILKITRTYRNGQDLINLAGKFVMKNEEQIKKKLKSNKKMINSINLIEYQNERDISTIVIDIISNIPINKTIALIGRYKKDIFMLDKRFQLRDDMLFYNNRRIFYYTVHASKGLGFDEVILINNKKGKYGFPSLRKESKIFEGENQILEERRLFYVALTRTKNHVYLLYPQKNYSCFISEIKQMN